MQPIIQISGLGFADLPAYPDLSLLPGQAVFIAGPSGCGKSTLLRLLNGTLSPSRGSVQYEGRDLCAWNPVELRRRVLLASQSVFLFDCTIRENFDRFYTARGLPAPCAKRLAQMLALCCVELVPDADCTRLSGGERQRVYLALFASLCTHLLLLDEPTSALDAHTGARLLENLLGYCREQGVTPVVISHDAALTARFSERCINLEGRPAP